MTQKWNLQDIRPAEPRRRRSTQEIPATSDLRDQESVEETNPGRERNYDDAGTIVIKNGNKTRTTNFVAVIVVILLIIGGVFGLSAVMSKTTLTIYPEFNEPTVNAEFIAYPERRDGQLSYEIMTITEEGESQVKATGKEEVESQAKGFLEIVKTTPGAERLIKNTRFRSPTGLVFRIQESVVVPGAVKDASGTLVPGTIRAEVFADNSGPEYNLPAGTRFDVPGFQESKLTELYNAIYAVNKEPVTGGFKGPRFIIDEDQLSTSKQALQMDLRNKLLARIQNERPADFVAFPGAVAITYNSMPTIEYGEDLVTIREQAVLQLPLFRQDDLASYLAQETIPTYMREPVRITNVDDLTFEYVYASTSASTIANEPALNFTIVGKPQIVWKFDEEELKTDLAGKALTAISTVLTNHTGIRSADISGKPFWKRSFPENKEDIVIIEVIGDEKSSKPE